jgi:hypothetical protein
MPSGRDRTAPEKNLHLPLTRNENGATVIDMRARNTPRRSTSRFVLRVSTMSYQSFSAFTFGYAVPAASLALNGWQSASDRLRSRLEPLALDVLVASARGWGWALGRTSRIARQAWAEHQRFGPLATALVQIAGALLLLHVSAQLGNQESDRLLQLELQKIWQFLCGRRGVAVPVPVVSPVPAPEAEPELPVVSVDEQLLTIADCGGTVSDSGTTAAHDLRKLCSVKGVQWRNAKGKGKHLTKREMIAAIA